MSDQLVKGTVDVTTKTITSDSMAAEIYAALEALVPHKVGIEDPLPRQKLAVAIATGVIAHLQKHAAAFHLDISDSGTAKDRSVSIDVKP